MSETYALQETLKKKPILHGDLLEKRVNDLVTKYEVIAEGLYYKLCCNMHTAASGVGKTVLNVQESLELSMGIPLYGLLEVPNPVNVYYMIRERPPDEIIERIRLMKDSIGYDKTRLAFDYGTQGFALYNRKYWPSYLKRMSEKFIPDIVKIDPIYAGNPGLTKEEIATEFNSFLDLVISEFGCCIQLGHHTTKDQYDYKGNVVLKEDPYFGSSYLKNYITGAFYINRSENGTFWRKTKDTHQNLLESIHTSFESENMTSRIDSDGIESFDRLKMFLKTCYKQERTTTFEKMLLESRCAVRTLRAHLAEPLIKRCLYNLSPRNKKALYKIVNGDSL